MSRIRIVGGTIAKHTVGKHNMYAEENIVFHSGKVVSEKGDENGVVYKKPKKHKPLTDIKVIKVEGPFDENGKLVKTVEKGKYFTYKATPSRKPNDVEIKMLKWATKSDNAKILELGGVSSKNQLSKDGKIIINIAINLDCEKSRVYAFYKKANDSVSVEIKIIDIVDAIMVVGAELHEPTFGNKMRFFAQAVRTLLLNKKSWSKVSLVYFKEGYNLEEINEVKNSLSSYEKKQIDFKAISNVSELISFINSKDDIKRLDFYSHGMPSKLTFCLGPINKNIDGNQTFSFNQINLLNKKSFNTRAKVYSYACRTGNNQKDPMQNDFTAYYHVTYFAGKADFSESFVDYNSALRRYEELKKRLSNVYLSKPSITPSDVNSETSLAQKMANFLEISVFAYKTRSDYQPTWHGEFEKILIPDDKVEKGWFGLKFWQEGDYALWHKTGALNPVKGGNTPKGLDNALFEFKPQN